MGVIFRTDDQVAFNSRVATANHGLEYLQFPSPIGDLLLTARDGYLTGLYISPEQPKYPAIDSTWKSSTTTFEVAKEQLHQYFAGERTTFDLELTPVGTPFQVTTWKALTSIDYGTTATYGDVAKRIGQPHAARAVGGANNKNPIAIIVPCHRVIGANGALTGYASGLDRKEYLLKLEQTYS